MRVFAGSRFVSIDVGSYPLYVGMAEAVRELGLDAAVSWCAVDGHGNLVDPDTPGPMVPDRISLVSSHVVGQCSATSKEG